LRQPFLGFLLHLSAGVRCAGSGSSFNTIFFLLSSSAKGNNQSYAGEVLFVCRVNVNWRQSIIEKEWRRKIIRSEKMLKGQINKASIYSFSTLIGLHGDWP
jgi:hypothetical protein